MIIFRYLIKELFTYMLTITLVLMTILLTNELAHYLRFFGQGLLTMIDVMKIMSTQVPLLLGYLLPMGFFLAILLGLGRLYTDYEMTVLFSCGLSRIKLFTMVFFIAVIVSAIVAILLLWVEPFMEKLQYSVINHAFSQASIAKIMPRDFKKIGNSVFYAKKRSFQQHKMYDVLFLRQSAPNKNKHHFTNRPTFDVTYAQQASQEVLPENANKFLVFHNGYRYVGMPGSKRYTEMKFKDYGVRFILPKTRRHGWPLTATTADLLKMGNDTFAVGMLQWRYGIPISVLILTLFAFPLSKTDPRQGKFRQIIPAIAIFTVYYDLIYMGRHWIEDGSVPVRFGLWWLHAVMLMFAFIIIFWFLGRPWFRRRIILRVNSHANS